MFTRQRFLALPPEQRQKKLAERVRIIYERLIEEQSPEREWLEYLELSLWNEMPFSGSMADLNLIADRYHDHLLLARQGIKEHRFLPRIRQGDQLQGENALPIAIYLDRIRSAHNIGSILRTVEAFRLGEVFCSKGMALPDQKQVRDASMGSWEWIIWKQIDDLSRLPGPVIVLETAVQAEPIFNFPFPECFTLAVGNEEYGCSPELLARADCVVEIPLRGRKNSLNVANAFAIAAAEIIRQKTRKKEG